MAWENYSTHYKEIAFLKWYSLGRCTHKQLVDHIDPDEGGRKPHPDMIAKWRFELEWNQRADKLDGEAAAIMEQELVQQTVQMWKEHADAARTIAHKALDYLETHDFDSSSSAVQAIKWAQEEERKTRGAEAFITAIKNQSTEQLFQTIRELAERKASTDEFVEGSEVTEQLPEGEKEEK